MKRSTRSQNLRMALAWSPAALVGSALLAAAPPTQARQEVEIHVFSGRPNPVFMLTEGEAADVKGSLTTAPGAATETGKVPATLLPARLGYRGISLREYAPDGRLVSETQISGQKALVRRDGQQTQRLAASKDVEREMLDLALAKGVIDAYEHAAIQKEMERHAGPSSPKR
jgi:hypothetical protein